jgi:hypothetical protein
MTLALLHRLISRIYGVEIRKNEDCRSPATCLPPLCGARLVGVNVAKSSELPPLTTLVI